MDLRVEMTDPVWLVRIKMCYLVPMAVIACTPVAIQCIYHLLADKFKDVRPLWRGVF